MPVAAISDQQWTVDLADIPGLETVFWDLTGPPPRPDIELVVQPYMTDPRRLALLAQVPQLRAVQLLTAGFEHAVSFLPPGVTLSNGAGVHDSSTAELAVGLTLAALRGVPQMVRAQERGQWLRLIGLPSLADRRVLVLGYGSIGRAIVRRLAPFEVTVTAVASKARPGDDLVSAVHGIDELPQLLPQQDVVILILPLSETTRHMVNREFLGLLPDGALVVNVARGAIIDTDALLAECASGRLLAALDVTDPEPLPPDHPLWRTEGVLISPHVGGASSAFRPRAAAMLRAQLTKFASGQPLDHVVAVG